MYGRSTIAEHCGGIMREACAPFETPLRSGQGRVQRCPNETLEERDGGVQFVDRHGQADLPEALGIVDARVSGDHTGAGQNLLEFGDQRLRLRVMDRKNTDRLAAHPILVEAEDGVDGRPALSSVADDDEQIVRWVGSDRTGSCREAFQEFRDRLHRDMLQWNHRDSITRLRIAALPRAIDAATADGVVRRNDMVAPGIVHQYRIARVQGALQDEQHLGFRNRTSRGKADGSLHPRIDRITHPENVAQNDLRHGAHGTILEVQIDAVARSRARARARVRRGRRRARSLPAAPVIYLGTIPRRSRIGGGRGLRKSRLQVDGANPVHRVRRLIGPHRRGSRASGKHRAREQK
jgi:hypothetical protein